MEFLWAFIGEDNELAPPCCTEGCWNIILTVTNHAPSFDIFCSKEESSFIRNRVFNERYWSWRNSLQTLSGVMQHSAVKFLFLCWPQRLKITLQAIQVNTAISQMKGELVSWRNISTFYWSDFSPSEIKAASTCREPYKQTWVWMAMASGKQGFLWAHFN